MPSLWPALTTFPSRPEESLLCLLSIKVPSIAKVREYEQGGDHKETAMKRAIQYCIKNGILEEFLERNGSEVINMLLTEWNWDDAKEVWQAEAREEGIERGKTETAKNALAKGLPLDTISEITGLDVAAIKNLTAE
jgi:predicted transposase/invertase (TIGR01784 family)